MPKKKKSYKLLFWKQSTNICRMQGRKTAGPVRNSKGGLNPRVLQIRSSLPVPSPPSSILVSIGSQAMIVVCFTGGGWAKPRLLVREVPSTLSSDQIQRADCISFFFNLCSDKHLGLYKDSRFLIAPLFFPFNHYFHFTLKISLLLLSFPFSSREC